MNTRPNYLEIDKAYDNVTTQLEEVYEVVCGEDGINRYTHEELVDRLDEMYDCYIWIVEYGNELQMKSDLKEMRSN